MNIGMYTDKEIYDTLANGMLQRSMVDAMVFGIKDLQQERDQSKNNWEELKKWIKENSWYYNTSDGCQWVDQFKILNKMKELEEDK